MITQTPLTKAVDKTVAVKMVALDALVTLLIEPLTKVGNPESLIGKPYEEWTPDDLQKLIGIYGQKEPNPLTRTIFRHEYAKVQDLESQVSEM